MLQFPSSFMRQFPSPTLIPSSVMLPLWSGAQNDEVLLSVEEAELEQKWIEIRKTNSNLPVIGKTSPDQKEDLDADAEEEDADNIEESDGDEFEQEAG